METERFRKLHGFLAKYDNPEDLIAAANRAYEAGYRKLDAYTPYPVTGLDQALHLKPSPLPYAMFAAGLLGGIGAFGMQWFATVIDYPLNIGGRPLFSWPTYIPITFEVIVLAAAVTGFLGVFAFSRLPQPYHPVFNSDDFNQHASQDAFYLDIQAADPNFDRSNTRRFIEETLKPVEVIEVEA